MRNLLLILCFGILFFSEIDAQTSQSLQINENSIIKNPKGELVALSEFIVLMDSKDWTLEPRTDKNGSSFIQLIRLSDGDKNSIAKMQERNAEIAGIKVPYFEFIDSNGTLISSQNTKGKVVVFNFWFTSCPPCIQELPDLNDVYKNYKDNDNIVFAAITFEKQNKIEKFLMRYTLDYPIVAQQSGFSQQMSRGAYPTNVIIGKDGSVQEYIQGGAVGIGREIEVAIEAALN